MDTLTLKLMIIAVVVIATIVIGYRATSDFLRLVKQETKV